MRATPRSRRMSAGTRSNAITAQAPASSAIFAWSAVVTSMMTPPFSISARPDFTVKVPVSRCTGTPSSLEGPSLPPALRAGPGSLLERDLTGVGRHQGHEGAPGREGDSLTPLRLEDRQVAQARAEPPAQDQPPVAEDPRAAVAREIDRRRMRAGRVDDVGHADLDLLDHEVRRRDRHAVLEQHRRPVEVPDPLAALPVPLRGDGGRERDRGDRPVLAARPVGVEREDLARHRPLGSRHDRRLGQPRDRRVEVVRRHPALVALERRGRGRLGEGDDVRRFHGTVDGLRGARERQDRPVRVLHEDLRIGRARAPHGAHPGRGPALEDRHEPGDPALDGLLVDHVGAVQPRERVGVAGVLDLDRDRGAIRCVAIARQRVARERTGGLAVHHRVERPLERTRRVPRERQHTDADEREDEHAHDPGHDLPSFRERHRSNLRSRSFARKGPSPGPRPSLAPDRRPTKHPADPRRERHISSSRRIRSASGGWVENSRSIAPVRSPSNREGWFSQRWAVALFAERIAVGACCNFFSAPTNPGGYRVSIAPCASARYSRLRETASRISCPKIGARISSRKPTAKISALAAPPESLPRRPRKPPHHQERMKNSDSRTAAPTNVATTVPTRMSRSATCAISCPSTPSSSTRFIVSSSPCVTARWLCSGSRPVANAFGAASGTTHTRGFGTPAAIASPSTRLCSRGASSFVTSRARVEASTIRSPYRYDPTDITTATTSAITRPIGPLSVSRPITYPTIPNSSTARTNSSTVLRLFDAICSYTG